MSDGVRRWSALGALTLAVLCVGLDSTILSVALPTLATKLHASASQLQWFFASYTLVLAAALLPGGLLGDRFGRKAMLMISLGVFGAGSVWCAYSTSAGEFIAARVLAGIGAALLIPVSMSMLPVIFTEEQRTRAVGIWAAANFVALPLGPILGGWILTRYWWGWVFLLNVPVVAIGLVAVALLLPESRSERPPSLDLVGVLTSSVGLAVLTYGFIRAGQNGWSDGLAIGSIVFGAVVLVAFVLWERVRDRRDVNSALVDLGLFKSVSFTWGTILAGVGIFAMFGLLFTAPQYFQAVLGKDAMGSGIRLLPTIGGLIVGALAADQVGKLIGAKLTVAIGFVLLATGLILGARTTTASGDGYIALWTAICGLGLGPALATASSAALGELTTERAGVGSAMMQAVQKVGVPFSAAILGSVLNASYRGHLQLDGLPADAATATKQSVFGGLAVAQAANLPDLARSVRAAFVHGMDTMLWWSGALAAAGAILSLIFLPGRRATRAATASGDTAPADRPAVVP